jgi:hypothetical protein
MNSYHDVENGAREVMALPETDKKILSEVKHCFASIPPKVGRMNKMMTL